MTFPDLPYVRPDYDAFERDAAAIFERIAQASTFDDQWQAVLDYVALREPVNTASQIAYVRNSIDTRDAFYADEMAYLDENSPRGEQLNTTFYGLLLDSRFRDQLTEKLGQHFFDTIALKRKVFAPEIMDDLAAENALVTAYDKLIGAAEIAFRGETHTLAGLGSFAQDGERATRKEAQEAGWGYFEAHADEFDRIYDELVHVRSAMAAKLGYDSFTQMAYDRMGRTGWGPEQAETFRAGVLEHVVPRAAAIFAAQRERIGTDGFYYYDVPFEFASGNPTPQGDEAFMKDRARTMYDELAPETSAFFRTLLDEDLMDLTQKPGKRGGGYCTDIEGLRLPFIFSNFNGTAHDAEVLTHEFGHALQVYTARDQLLPEQWWPGMEGAEVFSMSMEYLTYPWMDSFFGADATKHHYAHQAGAITFLPYGALVDAFQHWVYANPDATPAQRKVQWRELERQFTPWIDYADNAFLDAGARWQRQGHLYWQPFYYIDYCLAQLVAMQVFLRAETDRAAMWRDYLTMAALGGSVDFVTMLEAGGMESPFDPAVVGRTLDGIEADMASIPADALR